MKKTLLVTQMFPPKVGGAENYYYMLCQHLPSDKLAVLADAALLNAGPKPQVKFHLTYKPFFYKSLIWPRWLRLLWHLSRLIRREKPEILWAGEVLPAGIAVRIISWFYRLPYIISAHGADLLNAQGQGRRKKWKTFLLKIIIQGASLVTANSEYTRLLASKLGLTREKTLVVYPCAVAPDAAKGTAASKAISEVISLKKSGFTILLGVQRLVERKGVDMVIKSLPLVWQQRPKVAYVIAGSGTQEDELKELASRADKFIENRRRIIFTGYQTDAEIRTLYDLCDIFVLAPREIGGLIEGFGIVYIEAGFFARPVIGGKVGGVPEAVRELYDQNYSQATGVLVENPLSRKEIAKKILMLVKDKGLAKKLGENNQRWAGEFSWAKESKKLENTLDKINYRHHNKL